MFVSPALAAPLLGYLRRPQPSGSVLRPGLWFISCGRRDLQWEEACGGNNPKIYKREVL